MKTTIYYLMVLLTMLTFGCSTSEDGNLSGDNDNDGGITNSYSSYDFYIADKGCGIIDEFTKNFQPIPGYDKAVNFNVSGSNTYSFGAKKYRNNPETAYYTVSDNYSGYLSKNGTEIYSNIGGNSSSIAGVHENGTDLYFATGFKSQDGIVSALSVICTPKVYKNGTLLYTLSGPFNNYTGNGSGTGYIYSKSYGISISGILVKGNDVIIAGVCDDFSSELRSYGYWKNGIYYELKRINSIAINTKLSISDAGDYYFYFSTGFGKRFLFKNNADILNGTFNNVNITDFRVLNNDLYVLGTFYDNGYRLGIYKNGVLEYNYLGVENNADYKMEAVDNKIFICGAGIESNPKMTTYEYEATTKTLIKIGDTGKDYQSCGAINILDFQVKKK